MKGKLPVFNIERFAIHDGEGIRTAVFLQGCPLRCPWCANPESQEIGPRLMFLQKKCVGCGTCARRCPRHAISVENGQARIDRETCVRCDTCAGVCPQAAMKISGQWMTADHFEKGSRENGGMWYALNGPVILGMADMDREEAERLLRGLTLKNMSDCFPAYWSAWWSASDVIESSLIEEEGLSDQTEDYSAIPVYCAHPHAWVLYGWHYLKERV